MSEPLIALPWRLATAATGARARPAWRVLLLALMAAVCTLAFAPAPPEAVDTGWDKGNHALAFAVLAVVAALAFWPARRRDLWLTIGLLAFGAFIEVVQTQIPGRAGEWPDLVADATGIAAGLLLLGGLRWFGRRPPGTRSRS